MNISERFLVTGGSGFIGSHLMTELQARNIEALNIDVRPAQHPGQQDRWKSCDIKNAEALATLFREFQPTVVIHLAAKANLDGVSIADFPDNTLGTHNVVHCVNNTESVRLFVNTSTQYVVKPGVTPTTWDQLEPYTAYGQSKAEAELVVRQECIVPWVTIRPTNIWGPGHSFFPFELWRYLQLGYYLHPGFKPIYKYYGYVSNAVQQILQIALSPESSRAKVIYITDGLIDNADWMNGFSLALRGKPIKRIPSSIWRALGLFGDALHQFRLAFPVDSERFFRLTVSESLPDAMIAPTPEPSMSLDEGISRSVDWYRLEFIRPKA